MVLVRALELQMGVEIDAKKRGNPVKNAGKPLSNEPESLIFRDFWGQKRFFRFTSPFMLCNLLQRFTDGLSFAGRWEAARSGLGLAVVGLFNPVQ